VVRRLLVRKLRGRLLRAGVTHVLASPDNIVRAAQLYVPRPLAVRIVQFLAGSDHVSTQVLDDPRLGWRDFAENGFDVLRVGAHHADLLVTQAGELASLLHGILEEPLAAPGSSV